MICIASTLFYFNSSCDSSNLTKFCYFFVGVHTLLFYNDTSNYFESFCLLIDTVFYFEYSDDLYEIGRYSIVSSLLSLSLVKFIAGVER